MIGESFAAKAGLSKNDVANIGKYRFPSLQEAMNFMSGYGWKLAEAYSTTLAGSANTVWVIYKREFGIRIFNLRPIQRI